MYCVDRAALLCLGIHPNAMYSIILRLYMNSNNFTLDGKYMYYYQIFFAINVSYGGGCAKILFYLEDLYCSHN